MTSFRRIPLYLATAILMGGAAQAQSSNSDSATASASATIVSAIAIAKTADLDFGEVVAGGTSGTVVLSTANERSVTGGSTLGNAAGAAAASFSVTGDSDGSFSITLPSSTTITDGTNDMTVDNFVSSPADSSTLSSGTATISVGATLNVDADQVAGSYTGTFDVTVTYN